MECLKAKITEQTSTRNAQANPQDQCDKCGNKMQIYNSWQNVTHFCSPCNMYQLSPSISVLNGTPCPHCKASYGSTYKLKVAGKCNRHLSNQYTLTSAGTCNRSCGQTFVLTKKQDPVPALSELLQYQNGKFKAKDTDKAKSHINITVPDSLEDPSHFGHVALNYCRFMAKIKKHA